MVRAVVIALRDSGRTVARSPIAPVELGPGDWWHGQPEIPHWHGATPDSTFAHIAVTAGGTTTWLHEVTDEEYRSQTDKRRGHA